MFVFKKVSCLNLPLNPDNKILSDMVLNYQPIFYFLFIDFSEEILQDPLIITNCHFRKYQATVVLRLFFID